MVVLDRAHFPALHADGISDDSDVLQQAVNLASTGGNVLLVPSARYLISRTIGVPPQTRLIGFGERRPVLVLSAHTPGYEGSDPHYMIWFSGGRQRRSAARGGFPDASPGTFYSGLSNIDFEIQDGDPAAVAIRGHFAQHGIISHVDFHIGSGYAALDGIGNEAEDLHFYGGTYGIVTEGTSPSWQYTLLDSTFDGQRIAAFKTHNTGLTLIRDTFSNVPTAIAIDANQPERLWMKDCIVGNISGAIVAIGEEDNVRTQINLVDVFCRNAPCVALYHESGKRVMSPTGASYELKQFTYGLQLADLGQTPTIRQTFDTEHSDDLPVPAPTDILPLAPMASWVNLKQFGAKGDGIADDLAAFQAAIRQANTIFLPHGRYRVSDSIQLRPDTVLIGLNPISTQIGIDDGAPNFTGRGRWKGVVEAPTGGRNIIQGIGLDSGANANRAVALKWMAGEHSMVDDVKILGGHGTSYPDGRRLTIYNASHTGDGNPNRKWDSEPPSILISGGGGTFANIWTASTFSSCGMRIENTSTPGRIYELSSEHHIRNEIIMDHVANWEINAEQTEEEWGEGPKCLPLRITNCSNLTFANTILFRVFGMSVPFPNGIEIAGSRDIRFYGIRTYGQSAYNFDNPVFDASSNLAVRSREIALVNDSGNSARTHASDPAMIRLPGDYFSADHAVADADGNAYFVDCHQNRIFKYSPDTGEVTVLRDDPIQPFALALDDSGDLLILSHLGKAYSLNLRDPAGRLTELTSVPAAAHAEMTAVLPADRWWDGGQFLETNARREPLQFISPDHSVFIPVPGDFHTGRQHNWTSQPIDLYRGYQLSPASFGRPFYVADENEHKTWVFTANDDGTLGNPRLFAEHGEAGVAVDLDGNVYIAEGEIFVYNAAGEWIRTIDVPTRPLSLAFCGKDRRTLFIAARSSVYSMKLPITGK